MILDGTVLLVKTSCWYNGQLGLMLRHYVVDPVTTPGVTVSDVAATLSPIWGPLIADLMVDQAVFLGLSVRDLGAVPAQAAVPDATGAAIGTVTGDPLPTQTTGIVTLRTALAGRAERGRAYPPFPAEADNEDDDAPSVSYMVSLGLLGDEFILPRVIVGGGGTLTIVPVVFGPVAESIQPLIGFTARRGWATQRRRGAFGARNPREIAL